jgi:hypothetical protein
MCCSSKSAAKCALEYFVFIQTSDALDKLSNNEDETRHHLGTEKHENQKFAKGAVF